jgi:isoleucyl-tRNA synthetase
LLYTARSSWFIRTTQYKDQLVSLNQRINWYPAHIKDGRFGNWLENNVDWALGRERYWGTPLPIWKCSSCQHRLAVGSIAELSELAGEDLSTMDLHRPYIDDIRFLCPECGEDTSTLMQRVSDLIDVWFDSGSMPIAQWHYPFENQELFKRQYPADFICEGVDQTRGWFYSLHAISSLLFDSECYKNVICLGLLLDAEGQKMSKTGGNTIDPWDVINEHGADALRWYIYTASPPGQERRFSKELVGEVIRNFTLTLWNVYSFFMTYANLDKWLPDEHPSRSQPVQTDKTYSDLDRWLRSELHTLVQHVTDALENYDVLGATRPVQAFVDDLSKWYLRRSRRRFWKSESDADKNAAYATLFEALNMVCKLLAPTAPFIAEEIYQNLTRSGVPDSPGSVHLSQWPSSDPAVIYVKLNQDMRLIMKLASLGHSARNQAGIKVRQPLARIAYSVSSKDELEALERYADLLADELNVKQVRVLGSAASGYSLQAASQTARPSTRTVSSGSRASNAGHHRLDKHCRWSSANVGLKIRPYYPSEEVEVREARSGLVVASEGAYLAALTTELTRELIHEGLVREFVRRVQDLKAGLVFDRIGFTSGFARVGSGIETHRTYIMENTCSCVGNHQLSM